jgi:hypothetical protein
MAEKLTIPELRATPVFRALTPKQQKLVETFLETGDKVKSVLSAFSCSEQSARTMASNYFSKPLILEVLAVANGEDAERVKFDAELDRAMHNPKINRQQVEALKLFAATHGYRMPEVESVDTPLILPSPQSAAPQTHAEKSFGLDNITDIVAEGRYLRSEAEGLILWLNCNGGGTEAQKNYATNFGSKLRERAEKLKAAISARCENPAIAWRFIFDDRCSPACPENIRTQARTELGI